MSININSKKKWHPSRAEVQDAVKKFKLRSKTLSNLARDECVSILREAEIQCVEHIGPIDFINNAFREERL